MTNVRLHQMQHDTNKFGRPNENWALKLHQYVLNWSKRHQLVQQDVVEDGNFLMYQQCMEWYHNITIMTVTNSSTHRETPAEGFTGSAEGNTAQTQIFHQISRICTEQLSQQSFSMEQILTAINQLARKGIDLETSQQFYGDPSQTFVEYDPAESQMIRTQNNTQHIPRAGNPQGFRQPRQRPQRMEEEHHNEEEEKLHHNEEEEPHHNEEEGEDPERTPSPPSPPPPSPPIAKCRERREEHRKKNYDEGSSTAKKMREWWRKRF